MGTLQTLLEQQLAELPRPIATEIVKGKLAEVGKADDDELLKEVVEQLLGNRDLDDDEDDSEQEESDTAGSSDGMPKSSSSPSPKRMPSGSAISPTGFRTSCRALSPSSPERKRPRARSSARRRRSGGMDHAAPKRNAVAPVRPVVPVRAGQAERCFRSSPAASFGT
jgi:hypothetical protein